MLHSYRDPLVTDSNEVYMRYTYDCSTVTHDAKRVEITSMSPETKKDGSIWSRISPTKI